MLVEHQELSMLFSNFYFLYGNIHFPFLHNFVGIYLMKGLKT